MRPTNFVQHQDAGVLDPEAPPPALSPEELVELPPEYSAIRSKKGQSNSRADATTAEGSGSAEPRGSKS